MMISEDGTRDVVKRLAERDRRVRQLHRIRRRGLSSACIEGIQASTALFIAVMDGDLQHEETLLPRMLCALQAEPSTSSLRAVTSILGRLVHGINGAQ